MVRQHMADLQEYSHDPRDTLLKTVMYSNLIAGGNKLGVYLLKKVTAAREGRNTQRRNI